MKPSKALSSLFTLVALAGFAPLAQAITADLHVRLKPVVEKVTKDGGSRVEREVAAVLRAMERGARHEGGFIPDGETAYLDLVGRVFQQGPQQPKSPEKPLIVLP